MYTGPPRVYPRESASSDVRLISIQLTRKGLPEDRFEVPAGTILREALLETGHSPYRGAFKALNCRGFGICGSCKVLVREKGMLWDRRACQIQCFHDLEIEIE